ncbi:hypothetical protein [Microseira wollei]|uniref:hypothetical protein n=1 Tax=Microseira wollei TaxID=467598 RepID=UPI001CFF1B07|nr:hypothetical protein [Microseira wollei]
MIWQTKCRGTAAAIWGINQQITVAVPLPQDGGGNLGHQPKDYGCRAPTPGRRRQYLASTKRLRLPCPYPRAEINDSDNGTEGSCCLELI